MFSLRCFWQTVAISFAMAAVAASTVCASQPTTDIYGLMRVQSFDSASGKAVIEITGSTGARGPDCPSVDVFLEATGDFSIEGSDRSFTSLKSGVEFDTTVSVVVMGDAPSLLRFTFQGCLPKPWSIEWRFQRQGDSLVTLWGKPQEPWVQPEGTMRAYRPEELPRDTTVGRFLFDLRDTAHFRQFKENEDWINPDRRMTEPGFYEIELQRYRYERAINDGFRGWPADSVPEGVEDTPVGQSRLDSRGDYNVYVDSIVGLPRGTAVVPSGIPLAFRMGMHNDAATCVNGFTNGFRIYSPTGATWTETTGDWTGVIDNSDFDLIFGINRYSCNGSNADTIGFYGSVMSNTCGMPAGFDEITHTITIGPIPSYHAGGHICIDSAWFPPSGTWLWAPSFPITTWSGPHCYDICDNTGFMDVSGHLAYTHRDFPFPYPAKPMRDIRVELWDSDWDGDELLEVATTNDDGQFWFNTVSNYDAGGAHGQDIFLRIYAQNDGARFVEGILNSGYYIQSEPVQDVTCLGWDTTIVLPGTGHDSGPFFAVDILLDAYREWLDICFAEGPIDCIDDCWIKFVDGDGTLYNKVTNTIQVDTTYTANSFGPDTWDSSTYWHEHGHYIADYFDIFEDGGGQHTYDTIASQGLGASEGFAHFWSCTVADMGLYVDRFGPTESWTITVDFESGWFVNTLPDSLGLNARGPGNEVAMGGLFWDIADAVDDDRSCKADWLTIQTGEHPDWYGDSLAAPTDLLYALLQRSERPDDIYEVYDQWMEYPSLGNDTALIHIGYEHGKPCCELRGDVDKSGIVDSEDAYALLGLCFFGDPWSSCPDEADIDGIDNGGGCSPYPDISDVVFLVTSLFSGGPAPPACP